MPDQFASCSSVRRAWFSTVQYGVEQPRTCVAIELDPVIFDKQEVLRSIVDPLMAIAAEREEIVRDELLDLKWFVADDRMKAELSSGAGVAFYP